MIDPNKLAKRIVDSVTEKTEKNPAAVALGRKGGLVSGKARAEKLSAERRKEIAMAAGEADHQWSVKEIVKMSN